MMKNPLATAEFFIDIREPEKAKIVLDLLKPYATTLEHLDQLGKLYSEIREFNDSLDIALKMYDYIPENGKYDLRTNIIRAYLNLNEPIKALELVKINQKQKPDDHPCLMDEAMCYFLLDRKTEGEAILRRILTEPHTQDVDNRVRFNLGTYDLRNGNFKEGLRGVLLGGRHLNIWLDFKYPKEQFWDGGIQPGKTLLLCADGGMGDEIITIRFMKHLRDAGMNPIWMSNVKSLKTVFERCGFQTIDTVKNIPPDWLWTHAMATPAHFDVTEDQLWYGPYLKPIGNAPKLPDTGKKKVGIKCMGNPKYDQDLHRTIPLEELLASIPEDYEIYSFHVDEEINHPRVTPLKDKIKSWDDTLDYIDQMDLIISSCTSLVHAAGAIGKETIVIVPILTYYTWAKPGLHTKWYGENLTILRQKEYNNWNAPLLELKEML